MSSVNAVKRYEKTFQDAVAQIDSAVQRGLHCGRGEVYDTVAVLTMRWSNDDIGVEPLERKLTKVFRKMYHFEVENYVIQYPAGPRTTVRYDMTNALIDFRQKYDGLTSLLIYVYSGHAWNGYHDQHFIWYGASGQTDGTFDWNQDCRAIPGTGIGHSLYLFDCSYPIRAAEDRTKHEFLVSSTMESIASDSNPNSFTNCLVDVLKQNDGESISVVNLHTMLVANMRAKKTRMEFTPVHIGAKLRESIVLRPLKSPPKNFKPVKLLDEDTGKVLVSLSLNGAATIPDVAAFENWLLTHLPPNLSSVKVEAAFQADSQIILFTLPLAVWNCLGEIGGFRFIDYVDSHNILLPQPEEQRPLAEHPRARGSEKIPLGSPSKRDTKP